MFWSEVEPNVQYLSSSLQIYLPIIPLLQLPKPGMYYSESWTSNPYKGLEQMDIIHVHVTYLCLWAQSNQFKISLVSTHHLFYLADLREN